MSLPWLYLGIRAVLITIMFYLLGFHGPYMVAAEIFCTVLFFLVPWRDSPTRFRIPAQRVFHVYDGGVQRPLHRLRRPRGSMPDLHLVVSHGRRIG